MEIQNPPPVQSQPQTVVQPPIPSQPVPPVGQNKKWVVIICLLVTLLSLGTGGFFAYKYTQLINQVAQPTPTISPTPAVNLSRDEILRDWKTFTDTLHRFSFQYPSAIELLDSNGKLSMNIDSYVVQVDPDSASQWGEGMSREQLDKLYIKAYPYPDKPELKMYPDSAVLFSIIFKSVAEKNSAGKTIALLDQILSTFRFVNQATDINIVKTACIALEGSTKAWDATHAECNEGKATKAQLQTFCSTYGGNFKDNVDVCRYTTGPCGPTATYTCSFQAAQ